MELEKKKAVIFDLDGTIRDLNGRKPYGDTVKDECINDLPIHQIIELTKFYYFHSNKQVLIVSGCMENARIPTMQWFDKHGVEWHELYMRHTRDYRPDEILKKEIYIREIKPRYNVVMVYDDRPKIVRMYRELGLKVADVGKGEEF